MVNVLWFVILATPMVLWPAAQCPASGICSRGHAFGCSIVDESPFSLAGGYCHRVFETRMVPYFAQFPVVEIDPTSASSWSSLLYRSNFARYGDQWDWQARRSYFAFLLGVENGWIVPKSRLNKAHHRQPLVKSEEISKKLHSPVKVMNPFGNEEAKNTTSGNESLPPSASGTIVRVMTSAPVMPLRIANRFAP